MALLFFCQTYDKTGVFHTGTPPPYGMAGNHFTIAFPGKSMYFPEMHFREMLVQLPWGLARVWEWVLEVHRRMEFSISHMMHQQPHQVVISLSDSLTFLKYRR
jgi:hypothetical protein